MSVKKKIAKFINGVRTKVTYSQPVYVPGYEYSPWRKLILLLGLTTIILFILVLMGYFSNDNLDSTKGSRSAINSDPDSGLSKEKQAALGGDAAYYPVEKVIDGDTIEVFVDGKVESVRLIGIDTPETNHPNKLPECFGKEAASYLQQLSKGKKVRIEKDPTQGDRDKYSRLLAFLFLEDGTHINKKMIKDGYAYEYTYDSNPYKYQSSFRIAQQDARNKSAGLWENSTCNGSRTGVVGSESTAEFQQISESQPSDLSCDPNYQPCVPNVSHDLNCDDLRFRVQVVGSDPHRLDGRDNDGWGCEAY